MIRDVLGLQKRARSGKTIRTNRRLTILELSEEPSILSGPYQSMLSDNFQMRRVSAKFVPRLLTDEKSYLVSACTELKKCFGLGRDFVEKIITADEHWVYGYDLETMIQSSQWKMSRSPRSKKGQSKSNIRMAYCNVCETM